MSTADDASPIKPAAAPQPSASPLLRLVAVLAVAFTLGNATWAAWDQDATYDEPFHVGWPERLLLDRNDGREQFRYDSKTPALLPAVVLKKMVMVAGVRSNQAIRFATRIPSLFLLVVALFLIAQAAGTADAATWWIGLLLAALDTNLAANATMATTDLAYSLVVVALGLSVTADLRPPVRASLVGAIVGLAFAVKYTAVLLVPVAAVLILARRDRTLWGRIKDFAAAALTACVTMCVLYLFVGVMTPLGSVHFETRPMQLLASIVPALPVPFPRSVLTGIDMSMLHNDPAEWASYIFGNEHRGGVWYYFVGQWLIKTPVALILASLLGLWGCLKQWRDPVVRLLGALFTIHLVYFSLFFATQIGLRFALQAVAIACVLAARGLRGAKPASLLVLAVLVIAERAPYWSDPIAFTNLAVWPKSRAYWYTADSNLDLGQNRQRVNRYAKKLGLPLVMDQAVVTPGLYMVGTNELTVAATRHAHRWLIDSNIEAINVGYTYFAFSMTPARFDQYLDAARVVPPIQNPDSTCAPPLEGYAGGSDIPFSPSLKSDSSHLWVVCVVTRENADLGFTVDEGRFWFGRISNQGVCDPDLLRSGQASWFRIKGGGEFRLCIRELTARRALEHGTAGHLTLKGTGAEVAVREVPPGAVRVIAFEPGSQR